MIDKNDYKFAPVLISQLMFILGLVIYIKLIMLHEHYKLYEELRPFYQLLYVYDIEKFDPNELKSLVIRLKGQLSLDQKEKLIYDELIIKSKANTTKRLN